jgi:hypothetical protein
MNATGGPRVELRKGKAGHQRSTSSGEMKSWNCSVMVSVQKKLTAETRQGGWRRPGKREELLEDGTTVVTTLISHFVLNLEAKRDKNIPIADGRIRGKLCHMTIVKEVFVAFARPDLQPDCWRRNPSQSYILQTSQPCSRSWWSSLRDWMHYIFGCSSQRSQGLSLRIVG